ncbi:MAG: putative quinol monooxygenase [Granulosicoccus sp.]
MLASMRAVGLYAVLIMSSIPAMAENDASAAIDQASFALVATFRVQEGQDERFMEAMKINIDQSRLEEGVVDYRSYQSPKDPTVFINFEAYTNEAAFQAHLETAHVKAIGPLLEEILVGEIEVEFLLDY